MSSPIYKTFFGKYIDLDRLLIVSEAVFEDRMGHGGYYVSFNMTFQLLESPLVYTRRLTNTEYSSNHFQDERGSRHLTHVVHKDDHEKYLCEINLNKQIQEILVAWDNWKKYQNPSGISKNVSFIS